MNPVLTATHFVVFAYLKDHPDSSPYDVYRALRGTPSEVPMQSVYRTFAMHSTTSMTITGERQGATGGLSKTYQLAPFGEHLMCSFLRFIGRGEVQP